MIKTIKVALEYKSYPIWLYDEVGLIIDNDNPPEWDGDVEFTNTFMRLSDLYDTFFIDNAMEFKYIGPQNLGELEEIKELSKNAISILKSKNQGKYSIDDSLSNDVKRIEEDFLGKNHTSRL